MSVTRREKKCCRVDEISGMKHISEVYTLEKKLQLN
jgi:hypothetical protein